MAKVIAINGSPKNRGNTATALGVVLDTLRRHDIESERLEIGSEAMHGCVGCGACARMNNRRCQFDGDIFNAEIDKLFAADGILIGSPVYYAGINGTLKSFLDRAFTVAAANGRAFRHKVGAGVVVAARSGEIAAWEQLNKYFTITEMFVPSGNYWNVTFGFVPGDVEKDEEGMQTLEVFGENMAWLLDAVDKGRAGLPAPREKKYTAFIR